MPISSATSPCHPMGAAAAQARSLMGTRQSRCDLAVYGTHASRIIKSHCICVIRFHWQALQSLQARRRRAADKAAKREADEAEEPSSPESKSEVTPGLLPAPRCVGVNSKNPCCVTAKSEDDWGGGQRKTSSQRTRVEREDSDEEDKDVPVSSKVELDRVQVSRFRVRF